jgi:hypothetical protein
MEIEGVPDEAVVDNNGARDTQSQQRLTGSTATHRPPRHGRITPISSHIRACDIVRDERHRWPCCVPCTVRRDGYRAVLLFLGPSRYCSPFL